MLYTVSETMYLLKRSTLRTYVSETVAFEYSHFFCLVDFEGILLAVINSGWIWRLAALSLPFNSHKNIVEQLMYLE